MFVAYNTTCYISPRTISRQIKDIYQVNCSFEVVGTYKKIQFQSHIKWHKLYIFGKPTKLGFQVFTFGVVAEKQQTEFEKMTHQRHTTI